MNVLTARQEDQLRTALQEIAAETPVSAGTAGSARKHPSHLGWTAAAAASVVLAAGVAVFALTDRSGPSKPHQAIASSPPVSSDPGGTSLGSSITYDLTRLLKESPRVVIGTVSELRRGDGADAGGIPYVLARVHLTEALRGPSTDVWAFDYDLGGGTSISSVPSGPAWEIRQSLLLFLAPSDGTVHEGVSPAHDQVDGGTQGRYVVKDGELVNAQFTLDQVRSGT